MMLKNLFFILPILSLTSCGESQNEKHSFTDRFKTELKDEGKLISTKSKNVQIEDLFKNSYSQRKLISFEGYIGQVPSFVNYSNGKMAIRIFPRRNQTIGKHITLNLTIGTNENQVETLPENFQQEDLHVYTKNKVQLGVGDKVLITATNYYTSSDFYSMDGITVEATPEKDITFKGAVALADEVLVDTSKTEVYGYMEGLLTVPSVYYTIDDFLTLDFTTATNSLFKNVDVRIGNSASSMKALPSNYTLKDLNIKDYNGNKVPIKSKVRVYGTWNRYKYKSSSKLQGEFKAEEIVVLH